MSRRPRSTTTRARVAALATLLGMVASIAVAQHALDANLAVGASRVNPRRIEPQMGAQIYTVNRRTGEMNYNRANAFNDNAYQIHQRYSQQTYFDPTMPRVTTSGTAGGVRAQTPAVQRPRGPVNIAVPSPTGATPAPRALRSPSPGLATPVYSAVPAAQAEPAGLSQGGYRIRTQRVR